MGKEIDLLINYPKSKRNPLKRLQKKSPYDQKVARKFGKEFFDGERKYGYGGYRYNPKFWKPVIPTFKNFWNIKENNSILDVGCGKGFMLYDFRNIIHSQPNLQWDAEFNESCNDCTLRYKNGETNPEASPEYYFWCVEEYGDEGPSN